MSIMDELPTDYDTIVVGTGMPECILAAAHARNERLVLHLDRNDYYGGPWASFNFCALESWIGALTCKETTLEDIEEGHFEPFLKEGESAVQCHYRTGAFTNISIQINVPDKIESEKIDVENEKIEVESEKIEVESEKIEEEKCSLSENEVEIETKESGQSDVTATSESKAEEEPWTLAKMRSLYRKFNLDLAPKLLFSRGELVELLISSNIARYAEFKAVTRVLTYLDDKLELVPCSRADVFTTKNVSVIEKRMLMKLLTFCLNYEQNQKEYEGFEDKTFLEFLKSRKLTDNLLHYVMHAIAMVTENAKTLEGLEATRRFLNSLGRFGNTPFLWPLYGSGELPQCFCRLCAVFGGIYYLKRGAEAVIVNSDGLCTGIVSGGKRMNCKWLVMQSNYAPTTFLPEGRSVGRISRAIVITDMSLLTAEKEQITLLRLPKGDLLANTVSVLELGSGAMVCPPGLFVVYLSAEQSGHMSADKDLAPAMDILFGAGNASLVSDTKKPKVLWSLFFNQNDSLHDCDQMTSANLPKNVALTSAPSSAIDFDDAVKQSMTSFKSAFPDEEFLPRAPDPEEIIFEGAEENVVVVEDPVGLEQNDESAVTEAGGDANPVLIRSQNEVSEAVTSPEFDSADNSSH